MEEKIRRFLNNAQIEYEEHISMADRTWIHRGPVLPFLIYPKGQPELKEVMNCLKDAGAQYKLIGHTSNLYFKPSFYADAIVSTRKMTSFHDDGRVITCDSGVSISKLSEYAVKKGYQGFEGLVGLPGTVGAAVVNNSSCFKCSVSELVDSVEVLENGELHTLAAGELAFRHRSSSIKSGERNAIILGVRLLIKKTDDVETLQKKAKQNIELRKLTQEGKANNLGSIFSGYHPKTVSISLLGWTKVIGVVAFHVREHFFRNDKEYQLKRNRYLFKLFGYNELAKYVSDKNINCFVWRDSNADLAFDRYLEFMNHYAKCDSLEIEICE